MEEIKKTINGITFAIKYNDNGFSVWENDTWIMDGSRFLEDGEIRIDDESFTKKRDDRFYKETTILMPIEYIKKEK